MWLEPNRGFLSDEFFNMKGLGALYSRVSSYIFADWNKCGEVMGLAPYGRPEQEKSMIELKDGVLEVPDWTDEFDRLFLPESKEKWEDSPHMQHWQDLAWRAQDDTERVLLDRAIRLREATGAKNLCIAGGVGLNCVANGRIVREAGYDNVWIQPAAGDDGIAIGCAYYGHLAIQKKPRNFVMNHAYLGVEYTDEDAQAGRQQMAGAARNVQQPGADESAAKPPRCWQRAKWSAGFRAAPNSARARSAIAASSPIRAKPP